MMVLTFIVTCQPGYKYLSSSFSVPWLWPAPCPCSCACPASTSLSQTADHREASCASHCSRPRGGPRCPHTNSSRCPRDTGPACSHPGHHNWARRWGCQTHCQLSWLSTSPLDTGNHLETQDIYIEAGDTHDQDNESSMTVTCLVQAISSMFELDFSALTHCCGQITSKRCKLSNKSHSVGCVYISALKAL